MAEVPVTADPSHDELRDMLPAAALEVLDSADLALVLTHTDGCVECARLLEEYREVSFALATQLPPGHAPQSAALRARLLARARREFGEAAAPRKDAVSLGTKWMGWTVAAGLAGLLLMHHAVHRPLDYGWLATGALSIVVVAALVYAGFQRRRVSALRDRVAALEREAGGPEGSAGLRAAASRK
jgi:hypothetical protein